MQSNITFSDAGVKPSPKKKTEWQKPTLNLPPRFGTVIAAEAIGIHANTLRRMIADGKAPRHVKIGNRATFTEGAIVEWLAERSA